MQISTSVLKSIMAAVFAAVMSSCKIAPPQLDPSDSSLKALSGASPTCAKENTNVVNSDGDAVTVCNELFHDRPYIHTPPDEDFSDPGSVHFYGGLYIDPGYAGGVYFIDQTGIKYQIVDAHDEAVQYVNSPAFPAAMHVPTNRDLFYIYRVTGSIGSRTDSVLGPLKTIKLAKAQPAILISGCALDGFLLGRWTGTVSPRLTSPSGSGPFVKIFDESSSVPIQITLSKANKGSNLAEMSGDAPIVDGNTYKLSGTIDNFSTDVVTASGVKFPSLELLGSRNPFLNAPNGEIVLYRQGNMHGIGFDNHWVITYPSRSADLTLNGMSDTLEFFTPAALIGSAGTNNELLTLSLAPHIPYRANGHTMVLQPQEIGKESDQCD